MARISPLDAKILKTLLKDGRMSYGELAKEYGISKNKVWKRCNAMEKKGIITGATTQINFSHLGFAALATLLIRVDAQQIKQAMETIGRITEVRAYRQYNSVYNIRGVVTLKDLNELDHIKAIIRQRLPTIGLKTYIWTGVRNIPENIVLNGELVNNSEEHWSSSTALSQPPKETTIDAVDEKIIQKLTWDGRLSFTQIAKELELSTNTVVKRYHKLVNQGTFKVSIQVNLNKVGYNSILDCNVAFTSVRETSHDIVEILAKIPNVIIITRTSGDYDLQVTALVSNNEQVFAIQDQISEITGITQVEASARKIPEKWPTPQQYISTI